MNTKSRILLFCFKFNPNDEHDKAHLLEDLQKVIGDKDTSQMTADELQFYYFKQHDYDNNNKLDGIELIQGYFLRKFFKICCLVEKYLLILRQGHPISSTRRKSFRLTAVRV